MKLYEITNQYDDLLSEEMDDDTMRDCLESVGGTFTEKALDVARYLQNLEAEASAIREAAEKMIARYKPIEKRVVWLREYLRRNMERFGTATIGCPEFEVKVAKNPPSVVIDSEALIPEEYKVVIPESYRINKVELKKALSKRDDIIGAHLEQSTRLVIR